MKLVAAWRTSFAEEGSMPIWEELKLRQEANHHREAARSLLRALETKQISEGYAVAVMQNREGFLVWLTEQSSTSEYKSLLQLMSVF